MNKPDDAHRGVLNRVSLCESDAIARTSLSRVAVVRGHQIQIPEGYKIAKGKVRHGDKFLNLTELKEGRITWDAAEPEDDDLCGYSHADTFALLIRPLALSPAPQTPEPKPL